VDAVQMRPNIDMTNGLVMSEAVMMGLGRYICREAIKQNRHRLDLLAEHPEINKHVSREKLKARAWLF
jgi:3-carboxy-cis,cis-muconate cycloisomerase